MVRGLIVSIGGLAKLETAKTAILVDGGFYRRIAEKQWGRKPPAERADELYEYALRHITCKKDARIELARRELYRIFYYDCPPVRQASVYHPLTKKNVNFSSKDESFKWSESFQKSLSEKRKVACRMGEVVVSNAKYNLKPWVTRDILDGKRTLESLTEDDSSVSFKQSGVDMRIGLDIASLSHGRLVDQIVLISGDMDFVPAAKTARRNGVDFILDPMGQSVKDQLVRHVDGVESFVK